MTHGQHPVFSLFASLREVWLRWSAAELMVALAFAFVAGHPAKAQPELPIPQITGPTQTVNSQPVLLHFKYSNISWSWNDSYSLWQWNQYWWCRLGHDVAPTNDSLDAVTEFGSGQVDCERDNNRWLGMEPTKSSGDIIIPKTGYVGGLPKAGFWYVRTRLAWIDKFNIDSVKALGGWSAWHRVAVAVSFPDAPQAMIVSPPKNHHFLVNRTLTIQVNPSVKRPDVTDFVYVFEWKRTEYHTRAKYASRNLEQPGDFLRIVDRTSRPHNWQSTARLQTMQEAANATTVHLNVASLGSHRPNLIYLYQFRVREHLKGSDAYGPWSPWRSFIVGEPAGHRDCGLQGIARGRRP